MSLLSQGTEDHGGDACGSPENTLVYLGQLVTQAGWLGAQRDRALSCHIGTSTGRPVSPELQGPQVRAGAQRGAARCPRPCCVDGSGGRGAGSPSQEVSPTPAPGDAEMNTPGRPLGVSSIFPHHHGREAALTEPLKRTFGNTESDRFPQPDGPPGTPRGSQPATPASTHPTDQPH